MTPYSAPNPFVNLPNIFSLRPAGEHRAQKPYAQHHDARQRHRFEKGVHVICNGDLEILREEIEHREKQTDVEQDPGKRIAQRVEDTPVAQVVDRFERVPDRDLEQPQRKAAQKYRQNVRTVARRGIGQKGVERKAEKRAEQSAEYDGEQPPYIIIFVSFLKPLSIFSLADSKNPPAKSKIP